MDISATPGSEKKSSFHKRQTMLGMALCALVILAATWFAVWALLHRETGVLVVVSRPPGAEVILNTHPTNLLTPAFLSDLPADSFLVTLRREGFRPVPIMQRATVQPNETTRTVFFMAPISPYDTREFPDIGIPYKDWNWRILHLECEPDSAFARVDGRDIHIRPPVTLLLEGGTHLIELTWPDGRTASETVSLRPGQASQTIRLKPE
jgi:hypothetical protein